MCNPGRIGIHLPCANESRVSTPTLVISHFLWHNLGPSMPTDTHFLIHPGVRTPKRVCFGITKTLWPFLLYGTTPLKNDLRIDLSLLDINSRYINPVVSLS